MDINHCGHCTVYHATARPCPHDWCVGCYPRQQPQGNLMKSLIVENGQAVTCILTPVPEGYEARWYRLPASLPPGTETIEISQLEYIFGGLYGKDRNLIRELPAPVKNHQET